MKGIVTIKKVFTDGTEEVVVRDENIITNGLAQSFVNIFSNSIESNNTSNLLAGYFQVGSGSYKDIIGGLSTDLRTKIYSLESPFLEHDYGLSATEIVEQHDQVYNTEGNFSESFNPLIFPGTFVTLEDSHTTRVGENSVYYRLVLGNNTANGKSVNEFGLFSRNPNNFRVERSSMIAYKALDEAIIKSDLFSLVIDWQIRFVEDTTERTSKETDPGLGTGFNVVVIMADDVGVDTLGMYDPINPYDLAGPKNLDANPFSPLDSADGCGVYPHTPTLSAMAAGGITFFNARANTMCSPTRANILTGKCAFSSPAYSWLDDSQNLIYKGLWGHGIAAIFNVKPQRMRGGLRALGVLNNFKNADPHSPYSPLGGTINLSHALLGYGDNYAERKTYPSSWVNTARSHPQHATGELPANFTIISDMLRSGYAPSSYTTGMAGKWHLASWVGMPTYFENNLRAYGTGWSHLHDIGRWDYCMGMYGNIDRVPIPGHAGDTANVDNPRTWADSGGFAPNGNPNKYSLSDSNMGYVNYFQYNYSGYPSIGTDHPPVLYTVSDEGYTTTKQTEDGILYAQGDASSFATNKTFADATQLFNGMQEPFFLYIPLQAPHTPYTYPPDSTVYDEHLNKNHAQVQYDRGQIPELGDGVSATYITYNALLENMDYCLSGFLDNIDSRRKDRTIFVFQGDNGQVKGPLEDFNDYVASGLMNTPNGSGRIYTKLLHPTDFADTSAGMGGVNNGPSRFKASIYDRGVLIPYIVSASFLDSVGLSNTSSMAFIDVVDIYNTIAEVANVETHNWPNKQQYHTDGISFLPILRGELDASTAIRQFSLVEYFLPLGGSIGNIETSSGTYTGTIGSLKSTNYDNYPWTAANNWGLTDAPDIRGVGVAPYVPYERRRGMTIRGSKSKFGNQFVVNAYGGITAAYGDILEASAGMYKLIRSSSGVDYDELYHLRDFNFDEVDPFEFNNLLAPWRGTNIYAGLLNEIGSDINDNLNFHWVLLRIYTHLRFSLNNYIHFRTYGIGGVNSMYANDPYAASKAQVETVQNMDTIEPI